MMEELEYTSVSTLLNQLKPGSFESWSCSEEVKRKLERDYH